jgi:hypothetical protein
MIKLCRGYAKEDRGRISIASRTAQEHGAKDTRAADGLNTTARYAWALKNLFTDEVWQRPAVLPQQFLPHRDNSDRADHSNRFVFHGIRDRAAQ